MIPVDGITIDVIVDNTVDMLSLRPEHMVSEFGIFLSKEKTKLSSSQLCSAHHGLSLMITVHIGEEKRAILFDAGSDPGVFERNARLMNLDLSLVEALVLSHGHFDHCGGLLTAASIVRESKSSVFSLPLYVHPEAFVKRALKVKENKLLLLEEVPSRELLSEHGIMIYESSTQQEIIDGFLFISGEIPRKSFERGLKNHFKMNDDGKWVPDPLIMDERFVAAYVRDKGIVIFSGCSHAGVINICTHATELFKRVPIYAFVGGLHLAGTNESLIPETVAELKRFDPWIIVPGHCSGWKAVNALSTEFGESRVNPLAAGSRIFL